MISLRQRLMYSRKCTHSLTPSELFLRLLEISKIGTLLNAKRTPLSCCLKTYIGKQLLRKLSLKLSYVAALLLKLLKNVRANEYAL